MIRDQKNAESPVPAAHNGQQGELNGPDHNAEVKASVMNRLRALREAGSKHRLGQKHCPQVFLRPLSAGLWPPPC